MSADGVNRLKKAADLIRKGKTDKAQALLVKFLRAEPKHAQAWYLLSYTLADPQQKQYALQQALRVDPQFDRAQERLLALRGQAVPGPKVRPWPLPEAVAAPAPPKPAMMRPDPEPETGTIESERALQNERRVEVKVGGPRLRRFITVAGLIVLFALVFVFGSKWFAGLLAGGGARPTGTVVQPFRTLPPTWTPSVPTQATP